MGEIIKSTLKEKRTEERMKNAVSGEIFITDSDDTECSESLAL